MRIPFVALGAAACLALAGCSTPKETPKKEPPAAKAVAVPEVFKVNLDTSKGLIVIEVHRAWSPHGSDQFHTLVDTGFYDDNRFFRVARNFVVQFGINGDPRVNRLWASSRLPDDPVKQSNTRGAVTYAANGPNTRTTQLFINLKDNKSLDKQGFAPIGMVVSGMDVVERFYGSYGDMAPLGPGPDPTLIETQGNDYLAEKFSRLDFIRKATLQ
jgi:cyclophilin family peptidyl-prolyl cis-trans isomerase